MAFCDRVTLDEESLSADVVVVRCPSIQILLAGFARGTVVAEDLSWSIAFMKASWYFVQEQCR
jgi:hypothetical protein